MLTAILLLLLIEILEDISAYLFLNDMSSLIRGSQLLYTRLIKSFYRRSQYYCTSKSNSLTHRLQDVTF
jgi:hypothetical protein